ncbi:MAG: PhzF family phenazine biosynthesis protein [Acidobacteriota bacterium]|nr:PhzF family phenazine biosynthesis protein [Acidobacteriota bacterium]
MGFPLFHVDAFTDRLFAGNPAAVCLLGDGPVPDDAWHQNVARELNLSETAFLKPRSGSWDLRWFTPAVEVDLCGHATLASAHVLWQAGFADRETKLDFHTRSGKLSASQERDGIIELDFPAERAAPAVPPPHLLDSLNAVSRKFFGKNRMDYLLELEDEEHVRMLRPDFPGVAEACRPARGVIVTARSERPEHDFVSRYFAPAAGIDEDPVTGSAHCCLGPFWAERLRKTDLVGYQASPRGGFVGVRVRGDRVGLRGRAVSVSRGELL